MLEIPIKYFFIFITSVYTFYKILNITPRNKNIQLLLLFFSSVISISITLLSNDQQALRILISFTMFFLIIAIIEKLPLTLTYITSLFAFAFSYIVFTISIIFTSLILLPFYRINYEIPWFLIQTFIGIMQFILIYVCFHIPRLRKGMTFIYNVPSANIGSTLCIVLIMLIIITIQTENENFFYMLKFFSAILISSILLIYWWNYHITQTYRKFLRKNELDSLNLLLEERNQQILALKGENDYLAELIHKDNKMIPPITKAILESHENKTPLDLSEWETDSPLYKKLKQFYDERIEAVDTHEKKRLDFPHTGFDTIDASLSLMKSETLNAGIPFEVVLFDSLRSTIPDEITEDDFNHMLSNLLSNAFNACLDVSRASIQVYLGKKEGILTVRIYNSGNVFNIETLNDLGLSRHTTHADTGGSGIGLMSIWKLKQKYKATLLIEDTVGTDSVSKSTCMNILFNHKNHYIIQSNRYKELTTYINRPDVMIISKD